MSASRITFRVDDSQIDRIDDLVDRETSLYETRSGVMRDLVAVLLVDADRLAETRLESIGIESVDRSVSNSPAWDAKAEVRERLESRQTESGVADGR